MVTDFSEWENPQIGNPQIMAITYILCRLKALTRSQQIFWFPVPLFCQLQEYGKLLAFQFPHFQLGITTSTAFPHRAIFRMTRDNAWKYEMWALAQFCHLRGGTNMLLNQPSLQICTHDGHGRRSSMNHPDRRPSHCVQNGGAVHQPSLLPCPIQARPSLLASLSLSFQWPLSHLPTEC